MKIVCQKETITRRNSYGDSYEREDPFLSLGKVYDSDQEPFIISDDMTIIFTGCEKWKIYDWSNFITLEDWREKQLNKIV